MGAYIFLHPQQVTRCDQAAVEQVDQRTIAPATAEDLPTEAAAITARFDC